MNYIEGLNTEEKVTLCSIITGKRFKALFLKNESKCLKLNIIRNGFRVASLTNQEALLAAIDNIKEAFILTYCNKTIGAMLKAIQKSVDDSKGKGNTDSDALAIALESSDFANPLSLNNISLYFKLIGKDSTVESYLQIYKKIEHIRGQRIKRLENEKNHLLLQIEEFDQKIDDMESEYESKIKRLEQDKNELSLHVVSLKKKLHDLESIPSPLSNEDEAYLKSFDDTDNSVLPSMRSDQFTSLCSVVTQKGQTMLTRHADLNHNGYYEIFHQKDDAPKRSYNRDKLYYKDGPSIDGVYGVWNWSSIPNRNDPSREFIDSEYSKTLFPIEIVVLQELSSLDDLADALKKGIKYLAHSNKMILSISRGKGCYVGFLCNLYNKKECSYDNNTITASVDCNVLPVYKYTDNDILHLNNGILFYRKAFAGVPNQIYHMKTPMEIVRHLVISSISWQNYKIRGDIVRNDYRKFKDFLSTIPVDDIIPKIQKECNYTKPTAKKIMNDFMNAVQKYVDGISLTDEIVQSAISTNSAFKEKAKDMIRLDWEKENKSLLDDAQNKLEGLKDEYMSMAEYLNAEKKAFDKIKEEEKYLKKSIAEKEKLAEDVEYAVSERIKNARKNVAEFIANMAFVTGTEINIQSDIAERQAPVEIGSEQHKYSVVTGSTTLDDLEAHHCWTDAMDTVVSEIGEAGVAEEYQNGLAAFLCAAYIHRQPLLLIGPNAIDIVRAFSAAISADKTHGILYCEGDYCRRDIENIGDNGEDIVLINNVIMGGWINRLPEILFSKDILFIATHPYPEDIQVEPKSLYTFMLPVFTEIFVDEKANGKYYGGYFDSDFKEYVYTEHPEKRKRYISKSSLAILTKNQIHKLVNTMYDIYPDMTEDDEFLFTVLPIFYASMKIDEIRDMINDSGDSIKISANLKRTIQNILGDI